MSKRSRLLSLVGIGMGAVALAAWAAEEGQLTLDQLPAAVKATLLEEAAGGEIKEIEAETENGKTVYEAEIVRDGKTIEIEIAADGTLVKDEDDKQGQKPEEQESERKVTEAEVPAAALAGLKKVAAGAQITGFSEEIEHGSTFYEGSWKTAAGANVDCLVTSTGDLVEIEEQVPPDQIPTAVMTAVRKLSGDDARLFCEKKTLILYEVKFRKGDHRHEILYTADGRAIEKEIEKGEGNEDD